MILGILVVLLHSVNATLEPKGKKTNILLKTTGHEKSVCSHFATGLEASSLSNYIIYSLQEVLTQEKMPISKDNIITQKDLL